LAVQSRDLCIYLGKRGLSFAAPFGEPLVIGASHVALENRSIGDQSTESLVETNEDADTFTGVGLFQQSTLAGSQATLEGRNMIGVASANPHPKAVDVHRKALLSATAVQPRCNRLQELAVSPSELLGTPTRRDSEQLLWIGRGPRARTHACDMGDGVDPVSS
jgi:hypothetical protein